MNKSWRILGALLCCGFYACQEPVKVDLVVYNARVYTVDNDSTVTEAFAVKDGIFTEVGSSSFIQKKYKGTQEIDAHGKPVYPGFIDGHAHFVRYSQNIIQADLVNTKSFAEVISRLVAHQTKFPNAQWLQGRGWDQNDWTNQDFPTNDTLNLLFPTIPVIITRVDGHAALANKKALQLAGITPATPISGGIIEKKNNKLTGLLIDNAVDLVTDKIPGSAPTELSKLLKLGQDNCFAVGLTSVVDAGLEKPVIDLIDSLQKAKKLHMRVYAMLNPSEGNKKYYYKNGPYHSPYLHVRSFKVYADGALGSRGASLLHPYHDKPEQSGFMLQQIPYYRQLAKELNQVGFQMNTHAIGDSANRAMLDIYAEVLKNKNDKRWRIEHAQVVNPEDIQKFGMYSIIPSVQPTHATSYMYWADERLGNDRLPHAYAYKNLLRQNKYLVSGSDFPVEDINPLYGFHAAVARQDAANFPDQGFQKNQALTRWQALYAMTRWAAHGNFEEKEKGSIEQGKFADFVVLDQDIMTADVKAIREIKVLQTFSAGKEVYRRK